MDTILREIVAKYSQTADAVLLNHMSPQHKFKQLETALKAAFAAFVDHAVAYGVIAHLQSDEGDFEGVTTIGDCLGMVESKEFITVLDELFKKHSECVSSVTKSALVQNSESHQSVVAASSSSASASSSSAVQPHVEIVKQIHAHASLAAMSVTRLSSPTATKGKTNTVIDQHYFDAAFDGVGSDVTLGELCGILNDLKDEKGAKLVKNNMSLGSFIMRFLDAPSVEKVKGALAALHPTSVSEESRGVAIAGKSVSDCFKVTTKVQGDEVLRAAAAAGVLIKTEGYTSKSKTKGNHQLIKPGTYTPQAFGELLKEIATQSGTAAIRGASFVSAQ